MPNAHLRTPVTGRLWRSHPRRRSRSRIRSKWSGSRISFPAERAATRWIVSTDPDEHVEKIRPYVDMGFRHLVFHAPGADQARFLNLYADQVLPRLRAAFG
jgi:alkanesulfonate monooxygenase SsuD/methylene tetrahydromethanopterin reductase-like flavin-dependent oxidoreductase (luciferase family)